MTMGTRVNVLTRECLRTAFARRRLEFGAARHTQRVTEHGATAFDGDWLRPSPRLAVIRRGEVSVTAGLVALGLGIGFGVGVSVVAGVIAFVVAVVAGLFAGVLMGRRVRAWGYAERGDDLLVRRGMLIRRLSVVPYGRMQSVEVRAGPIERSFGLATVRLHTAAAASDARIPGLTGPDARRLRDQLAALGEAKAAGL